MPKKVPNLRLKYERNLKCTFFKVHFIEDKDKKCIQMQNVKNFNAVEFCVYDCQIYPLDK